MKTTVDPRVEASPTERAVSFRALLVAIAYRLKNLAPGVNVSIREYENLRREQAALTAAHFDCMLKAKGYDFDADSDRLIAYGVVLSFGGTYRTLIRTHGKA